MCPNRRGCPGQVFQHIKHFAAVMDIEGFGEKLSARFLDEGLIRDQADVYDLTAEKLAALDGFGETSARNLVEAIEASKAQPFGIVLFALGLPEVGFVTAQALAEHFGTIDGLIKASEEEIEEVEGVGPIVAERLEEELSEEPTLDLIRACASAAFASSSRRPSAGRGAARWRTRRSSSRARWRTSPARRRPR